MFEKLKNLFKPGRSGETSAPAQDLRTTGAHPLPQQAPAAKKVPRPDPEFVPVDEELSAEVKNEGQGKSPLIRNKYVREDTGTHETLKILDDSLVDSGEEAGIDPYNTGGFDRSKNWDRRFGK